jgi:tetratricopeptide (TPR) repeat protein
MKFVILLLGCFCIYSQEIPAEKIYETAEKSVVVIYCYDLSGNMYQGSGVIIDPSGILVTNYHIYSEANTIEVKHSDKLYRDVSVIGYDITKDILILKVNSEFKNFLPVTEIKSLKQGQRVYAIGSPEGFENSISEGIISGFRVNENNVRMIQMTAPITDGSSGGAVLNSEGKLIGLSTSGRHEGNIYFAIPTEYIIEFLSNLNISVSNSNEVIISDGEKTTNYLEIGEEAFNSSNYKLAEDYYLKHLEKFSKDFNVIYKVAYSRYKIKEYNNAINDFTFLIANGFMKTESSFYRGNCYFLQGEYKKAIEDYSVAIEHEIDNAEIYYNRGYAYFRCGEYDKAINDWNICIFLKESLKPELEARIMIANELLNKTR